VKDADARTLYALLEAQAATGSHHPAVVAPGRRSLSYAGLLAEVDAIERLLRARGIGPGDPVAVVLDNGPEMAVTALGVACAAACAPLNPGYQRAEYEFFLSDLQARALILQQGHDSASREVAHALGIPVIELAARTQGEAGRLLAQGSAPAAPARRAGPQDVALVLHTSGTTSQPKLVPLSQANLCASAVHVAATLALTPSDRCLNVMPLFHIHGLVAALLASLSSGASVVCTPGFRERDFFAWVEQCSPTWYTAVPTIHQAVLKAAEQAGHVIRDYPLRFIRSSSAALAPPVMAALEQTFGCPVIEAYGMTEAAHQMTSNPLPPAPRKPGSAGRAAGPEVAIMDQTGTVLPPGNVGEIVIRGPNVTSGYCGNPDANVAAYAHGWFHTGDQGRLDAEGYLFITGRLKEIINRGGEKVSPREIDEALLAHAQVAQAVAFAVEHPRLGEDVSAAVVLHEGASVSEPALRDFLFERLADFKVPTRVVVVDRIPLGATGKMQRIGMAQRLAAALQTTYEPPRTPAEHVLARIWAELLGVETVGRADNFFGLGGDSLQATQVNARVRRLLGAELPLVTLFHRLTLAGYAAAVEAATPAPVLERLGQLADGPFNLTEEQLVAALDATPRAGSVIGRVDRRGYRYTGGTGNE